MKQLFTLISATLLASHASAAIISANVTGVLGDWFTKSWDVATSQVLYQHFLTSNPDIAVQGSLSYDDETEEIITLSLSQVGTLVATTVDADTMTISGLSWNLAGNGINIDQISGSASCSNAFARCAAMATAISTSGSNSAFEFDGVKNGFKIGSAGQSGQLGGYALTILPGGFAMDLASDQAIASLADTTSYKPKNVTNNAKFELTSIPEVPIPAAAWLMGSGLIGLMSIARSRR